MNSRRIVTVQLLDQDSGLPVEKSIVAVFANIVTEDTAAITIQEVIMNNDLKLLLEEHNKKRMEEVDLEILNRTGNAVKLRPVKLKDLSWVVQ